MKHKFNELQNVILDGENQEAKAALEELLGLWDDKETATYAGKILKKVILSGKLSEESLEIIYSDLISRFEEGNYQKVYKMVESLLEEKRLADDKVKTLLDCWMAGGAKCYMRNDHQEKCWKTLQYPNVYKALKRFPRDYKVSDEIISFKGFEDIIQIRVFSVRKVLPA